MKQLLWSFFKYYFLLSLFLCVAVFHCPLVVNTDAAGHLQSFRIKKKIKNNFLFT